MELAVALPHLGVLVGIVAPSAAHHAAAIRPEGGAVAEPPLGPHAPRGSILFTVIGRLVDEDQVGLHRLLVASDLLDLQEGWLPKPVGPDHFHLHGSVVFLFQNISNLSELG